MFEDGCEICGSLAVIIKPILGQMVLLFIKLFTVHAATIF